MHKKIVGALLINSFMKTAHLYWIRLADHTDIFTQGYVGVSQRPKRRFAEHLKECSDNSHTNTHLIHAYHKYGRESFIFDMIFSGSEHDCYAKEKELRPVAAVGWNISAGGHRGPGRQKGSLAQKLVNERNAELRKQREERIISGNLNEKDIMILERKKQALENKQQKALENKTQALAKKQQKVLDKTNQKLAKKQQKSLAKEGTPRKRDSIGALIQQQPRPICAHCKFSLAKPNGKSKHGFQKWHRYCVDCAKAMYNGRFKHLQHKQVVCEQCGFIPEDKCQLDLVLKDGNKNDRSKKNLLTLCANCSRLHNKKVRTGKKSILNATVDGDTRIS